MWDNLIQCYNIKSKKPIISKIRKWNNVIWLSWAGPPIPAVIEMQKFVLCSNQKNNIFKYWEAKKYEKMGKYEFFYLI